MKLRTIALFFVVTGTAHSAGPQTSIDVNAVAPITGSAAFNNVFHVSLGAGTNQGLLPNDELVVTALGTPIVINVLEVTATTAIGWTESARGGKLGPQHTASFHAHQCVPVPGVAPAQVLSPNQTPPGWMEAPITNTNGNAITIDVSDSIVAGSPVVAFAVGNARLTGTVDTISSNTKVTLASTPPAFVKWNKAFVKRSSCPLGGTTKAIPIPPASFPITSVQPVGSTSSIVVFAPPSGLRLDHSRVQVHTSAGIFAATLDSIGRSDATLTLDQKPSVLAAGKVESDVWDCGGPILIGSATQQPTHGFAELVPGLMAPSSSTQTTIDATGMADEVQPGSTALVIEKMPGKPPVYGIVDRVRSNGKIAVVVPTAAAANLKNNIQTIRVPRSPVCHRP